MEKTAPPQGRNAARITPAEARRAQQKARKHAAQEAARKAAAARKRRNSMLIGIAAVVVVVVAVVLIVNLAGGSSKKPTASTPSAGASAPVSAPASAPPAAFPPVPAGANAALKTKPVVKAGTGTVSALKVTTLIKGTGAAVQNGQSITVNYVGATYKDGVEFDSSWKSSTPFTFTLGQGSVIQGWDQGLAGVTIGSRVQLDIPQSLAYPDASASNGEPVGTLRFVVDVLSAAPAS